MSWDSIVEGLLSLGFRSRCPLCQRWATAFFCTDCCCQLQVCQSQRSSVAVLAWGNYTGALKRAIALLKYEGQSEIARPLGQWLAKTWLQQDLPQRYVVVPIPLHAQRQSQRGYNQAELIARSFCQVTGLEMRSQALIRCRATQAQFGLSIAERQRNLEQAFALGPDFIRQPPKWPVLLLDDIYTTGATTRAATHVLQQAGIRVQGVVAVAQAQRYGRPKPDS